MNLILTNNGSYPRIGETPELQVLRRTIAQWERKEKADEDLREAERVMVRAAIREQVEAGLDVVTDGQIGWYDPVSHLAGRLEGVKINGLLRFFDTNFYFRQPVVKGTIRWRSPQLAEAFRFASTVSSKPVKAVMTGPYTMARFSIVEEEKYRSLPALVEAMSEALAEEVGALAAGGAEFIQIDEPAIVKYPNDLPILKTALDRLVSRKGKARLGLMTYFGDATPLWEPLQALPVDLLGVDFTYSPKLVDRIEGGGASKPLTLGLVDGRNTRLEGEAELIRPLERMLPKLPADGNQLGPSCGLEYLPRDRAFQKLQNMARLSAGLRGQKRGGAK
ncbi:MAG: hypothetical protein HY650_07390 [Acidobacteria bacterium]|nr:hypothetical protein [Acidobacteriota bacterium]